MNVSLIDLFKIVPHPNNTHRLRFLPLSVHLLFLPYWCGTFFSNVERTIHLNTRLRGVSAILCDHVGLGG